MENDSFIHFGIRYGWGGLERPFGLYGRDRRHHCYIVGKTGSGKTTLLRNLILQDIESGSGVAVVDPHGDLALDLLDHIPPWRTDHVLYFDPADEEFPVAFNLLRAVTHTNHSLAASGVVSAFKSVWGDSWGPRMEYILYAAVASLLECDNSSILGLPRLLVDRYYRGWVLGQVEDPVLRSFWVNEFEQYDKRFMLEAISPILNKVGRLLLAPPIRNVLGQVKSRIEPRFIMDNRRIFIANLSKGRLGEDKSNLLGAFLVTAFQLAAMSRATIPEADRMECFAYFDEFQCFSTDSFASILSEARKFGLCLTLSHQYMDQLRDEGVQRPWREKITVSG